MQMRVLLHLVKMRSFHTQTSRKVLISMLFISLAIMTIEKNQNFNELGGASYSGLPFTEQKFLLEDDSNLDYSVGPRCPELGNISIWQSSPISLKQVLLLAVFPCMGPSLSPGNFLLFDPGPGFGPCSETATVSSPF